MKKLLSVLLCAVLCLGVLSVSAPALAQAAADAEKTTLVVELEGENALRALNEGLSLKKALGSIDAERKNAVQAIESVAKDAEVAYTYTHVLNGVAVEAAKGDIARIKRLDGVRAVYDVGGVKAQVEAAPQGSLISSGTMIGVDKLHEAGIDGTGTAIAVIDGGLEWDHEAMRLSDPDSAKITKTDVAAVLSANAMNMVNVGADDLYKSAKVPVAFDYGGNDTDPTDWDNGGYPDHGMHVSGIAAGNSGKLVGVAPEAQILIFKIDVSDDARFLATLLAAIDDAAKFDIASMNMSVGMEFEMRDDPAHELLGKAIENARNSGISVCTSAGNSGVFSNSVLDPDNGTNGIPNSFADSTSVASVDNVNMSQPVTNGIESLEYADGKKAEVLMYSTMTIPEKGEFVPVGKNGPESDTAGKLLLLYDPNVSILPYLSDKETTGMIMSESVLLDNEVMLYPIRNFKILLISDVDAYRLMHSQSRSYSLTYSQYYVEPADILRSSSYTSYGVSEDLELTVDVAAPGGIIYSSVTDGSYDIYGGTSMASPHIAGSAALLEQAIQKTYPDVTGREKADLKESMMCSTADPILSGEVPISPRAVGAGLVNLSEAVASNAVLLGKNERTAINIGDGIDDMVKLSFTVKNISKTDVRYDTLDFDVITDDYAEERVFDDSTGTYSTQMYITGQSVALDYTVVQSDMPRSITLHPGESKTVTCTLQLDAEQLSENAEVFTNGFYVEGYVYLTDSMTGQTPLNIPFMGFRGDWEAVPAVVEFGGFYDSLWGIYVEEQMLIQRNLKELTFELKDKNGNTVATHTEKYVKKGNYYDKASICYLFGNEPIPDGEYGLEVYVLPDVPNAERRLAFDSMTLTIDRHAPSILNVKLENTADGCDVIITCDCDDLDYADLRGSGLFDRHFYDIYPFDNGYDHVDKDGNYVYVVHERENLRRMPVVKVVDRVGYEDSYGSYSLIMMIWQFLRGLPSRIASWLRNKLRLGYFI